jgi:hypothetical protein
MSGPCRRSSKLRCKANVMFFRLVQLLLVIANAPKSMPKNKKPTSHCLRAVGSTAVRFGAKTYESVGSSHARGRVRATAATTRRAQSPGHGEVHFDRKNIPAKTNQPVNAISNRSCGRRTTSSVGQALSPCAPTRSGVSRSLARRA